MLNRKMYCKSGPWRLNIYEIKQLRPWSRVTPHPDSSPLFMFPAVGGGIERYRAPSVRMYVPWRSCVGYTHAGCLQFSDRRPPEMCGLRTRPRTDVDPPRFVNRTAIGVRHIASPPPKRTLFHFYFYSRNVTLAL